MNERWWIKLSPTLRCHWSAYTSVRSSIFISHNWKSINVFQLKMCWFFVSFLRDNIILRFLREKITLKRFALLWHCSLSQFIRILYILFGNWIFFFCQNWGKKIYKSWSRALSERFILWPFYLMLAHELRITHHHFEQLFHFNANKIYSITESTVFFLFGSGTISELRDVVCLVFKIWHWISGIYIFSPFLKINQTIALRKLNENLTESIFKFKIVARSFVALNKNYTSHSKPTVEFLST